MEDYIGCMHEDYMQIYLSISEGIAIKLLRNPGNYFKRIFYVYKYCKIYFQKPNL